MKTETTSLDFLMRTEVVFSIAAVIAILLIMVAILSIRLRELWRRYRLLKAVVDETEDVVAKQRRILDNLGILHPVLDAILKYGKIGLKVLRRSLILTGIGF